MKFTRAYLLIIVTILTSCSRQELSPPEYVHYIEEPENGLRIQSNDKGLKYSLQYLPVNYVVMQEKRSFDISPDTFEMLCKRFKGLEHYVFRIGRKGIDSLVNKSGDTAHIKDKIAQYFGYQIQNNIKLVEGDDTLACGICQFDGDYGIAPNYNFVIGFPVKEYTGDRKFIYDDRFFKTGEAQLVIKGRAIRNIPELKRQGV